MVGFTVVKGAASVVRDGWKGGTGVGAGRCRLVWVGAAWCGSVQLGMAGALAPQISVGWKMVR